jgi:hypothetical protein
MDQERRRELRISFIASAEVVSEAVGSRLQARISDICASGCYVDTINPLPGGTSVQVRIFNNSQQFAAQATVVYSHAHLGMGLAFREIRSNSQDVLQNWLQATA